MSTVTIALPDALEAALQETMKIEGVGSREEYLLQMIEDHCVQSKLERVLLERSKGPFVPLPPDWKEQVMKKVAAELRA